MLYPKIMNIKKTNNIIKIVCIVAVLISLISVLINELTMPSFKWSILVVIGILYCGITTVYSLKKNRNIASHIVLQTIATSILTILVDVVIGFKGWSFSIALPIILSVGNITMMILTLVSRKKYFRYAIHQIILFIINILFILLIVFEVTQNKISIISTIIISAIALIISISLCGKEIKEEINRMFHI